MKLKNLSAYPSVLPFLGILSFFCSAVYADEPLVQPVPQTEWEAYFTGPLLAPAGTVIPVGNYDVQPYLFMSVTNGVYDNHWHAHKVTNLYSLSPLLFVNFGLFKKVDFGAVLPFQYNWRQNQSSFGINDLKTFVGYQLVDAEDDKWTPWVKLAFDAVIPAGKYRNLNPDKLLTDAQGNGNWGIGPALIFYKLLHIKKQHFLSLNLNFSYTYFFPTKVTGFNVYGGGFDTHGRVRTGSSFVGGFSFEYSFDRYWAFAMDAIYNHFAKDVFSGCPGFTQEGTIAHVGQPSEEQVTLSPAIEYNFNQFLGIIGGVWFTVAGRNSNRFQSAVLSVNYFF